MTPDIGLDKLLVVLVIALFLVGPEKLPRYAEGFAKLLKRGAEIARGAKDRVTAEMGPEFTEADWQKLDPRQYDPRRIIREALLEEPVLTSSSAVAGPAPTAAGVLAAAQVPRARPRLEPGALPPFDAEAT